MPNRDNQRMADAPARAGASAFAWLRGAGRSARRHVFGARREHYRMTRRYDASAVCRQSGASTANEHGRSHFSRPSPRGEASPRSHLQRADAGDAAGGAGFDDRRDGAADDRRGSRRAGAAVVGDERLSARTDGGHAAVRQARRSVWAQARPAERGRAVPGGLGVVWPGPVDDRADRLPRGAGAWRGWPDRACAGDGRRRRLAARAWALSGAFRSRLRLCERRRASAGGRDRRAPVLALDLLCKPAGRLGRVGGDRGNSAGHERAHTSRDRLSRCRAARAAL